MLLTVGVGDLKISRNPEDRIITHALGSCLGITVYDPVAKVGGLLHVMLPLSSIDAAKAAENPFMFVDTGVPRLFLDAYKAGARKERLIVTAAGGASPTGRDREDFFQIGNRNVVMLRKILWKNGVVLKGSDFGAFDARTMWMELETGEVTVKINGLEKKLGGARAADQAAPVQAQGAAAGV